MLLFINDYKRISDLQDKFNECFPFLNIGFYDDSGSEKQGGKSMTSIRYGMSVGAVSKKHNTGVLEVKSWDKTDEVEKKFFRLFGLRVRILRRQNKEWVPVKSNEHRTLREESELAQASVRPDAKKDNSENESIYDVSL